MLRVAAAQQATPAQPAAHSVQCGVRHVAPTAAEIAYEADRFDEALPLFRQEFANGGKDKDRTHEALIRTLLRARHFTEANTEADAWIKAEPKDAWSRVALGEVQWRMGRVSEGVESLLAARSLDPCNPEAHVQYARVLAMSGLQAAAKHELDTAHALEPENPTILSSWVAYQPRAVQLANLTRYAATHEDLPEREQRWIAAEQQRLAAPPAKRCQQTGALRSTSIPYRGIQDGPHARVTWGLDVAFNGKGRRLEIDTGAHGLLLSRSAAAALHLVPAQRNTTGGMGDEGDVDSFVANVDSIEIGGLEFGNCDVRVLGKNVKTMEAQDGLIGGDVFSNFVLTLDFPGHVLKLDPLPPRPGTSPAAATPSLATGAAEVEETPMDRYIDPSMKSWSRVFRSGHDLILPVQLNDGPWRLFIVDTGSSLNLISEQAAREVAHVSNGSDIKLYGISGEVKMLYTTGPLTLTFGNLKQPTSGMTAMDTSRHGEDAGVDIAGFLGAPTLHQLTVQIEYRDDLIHFSYDPKRVQRCASGSQTIATTDCY